MSTLSAEAKRFRHELIKLTVCSQGMSFRKLADQWGCAPSLVTMVSKGQRVNRKVQKGLARVCGRPLSKLFPKPSARQETGE